MSKEKIKKIETKLKNLEYDLKRDPQSPLVHYKQAESLINLADLTNNALYYRQALECYDRAVEFSEHQNPLYLAARSMLRARMNMDDLAIQDAAMAASLPKEDSTVGNHIRYTMEAVINKVRDRIKSLKDSGGISKELADSLLGLAGDSFVILEHQGMGQLITSYDALRFELLASKVSELEETGKQRDNKSSRAMEVMAKDIQDLRDKHNDIQSLLKSLTELQARTANIHIVGNKQEEKGDDLSTKVENLFSMVANIFSKIKGHDDTLKTITNDLTSLLGDADLNEERMAEFYGKVETIEQKLAEHDIAMESTRRHSEILHDLVLQIAGIGASIMNIDEEIKVLKAEHEHNNNDLDSGNYEQKIKDLETARIKLVQEINGILRILNVTGIINQAEIKEQIMELQENNPQLHYYFSSLYFQLEGYFQVYQELGTGLIEGKELDSKLEQSGNSNSKWFAAVLGKAGMTMVQSVVDGYSCGAMSALYSIKDDIDGAKNKVAVDNQVTRIQKVIKNKLMNNSGELDRNEIAKLALKLVEIRKQQIAYGNKVGGDLESKGSDEKESEKLLLKLDKFLGNVKDKMIGELLERYQSPGEKLAANDALMLLCYMCNNYQKISTMEQSLPEFLSSWVFREIEVGMQLKDTLKEIREAAKEGHWESTEHFIKGYKVAGHKNIEGRLTDEYLQEKLNSLYSPENVEIAKMLYFAMINVGVKENKDQTLECIRKFKAYDLAKHGGTLIDKIAREHPEYFAGNREAVNICIEDLTVKNEILHKIGTQIYAVTEIIYDNPLLNHPEFIQEYAAQFGAKALSDLIDLMGVGANGEQADLSM